MLTEELLSPTEAESSLTSSLKDQLLTSLKSSKVYRHAFTEESLRTRLTAQIAAMRQAEEWDYKHFADTLGKKVSWAYRLEDPNQSIPTVPTLLEVARAFDVALDVRFVPFSQLLGETTSLSEKSFDVVGFDAELPSMEWEIGIERAFGMTLHAMRDMKMSVSRTLNSVRPASIDIRKDFKSQGYIQATTQTSGEQRIDRQNVQLQISAKVG